MNKLNLQADPRTFIVLGYLITHPDGAATVYDIRKSILAKTSPIVAPSLALSPGAFYSLAKRMIKFNLLDMINYNHIKKDAPPLEPQQQVAASSEGRRLFASGLESCLNGMIDINPVMLLDCLFIIKTLIGLSPLAPTIKRLQVRLIGISHEIETRIQRGIISGDENLAIFQLESARCAALVSGVQILVEPS